MPPKTIRRRPAAKSMAQQSTIMRRPAAAAPDEHPEDRIVHLVRELELWGDVEFKVIYVSKYYRNDASFLVLNSDGTASYKKIFVDTMAVVMQFKPWDNDTTHWFSHKVRVRVPLNGPARLGLQGIEYLGELSVYIGVYNIFERHRVIQLAADAEYPLD